MTKTQLLKYSLYAVLNKFMSSSRRVFAVATDNCVARGIVEIRYGESRVLCLVFGRDLMPYGFILIITPIL